MIKNAVNCAHAALIPLPYHATQFVSKPFRAERRWLITHMQRPHIKHFEGDAYVIQGVLFACDHHQANTR